MFVAIVAQITTSIYYVASRKVPHINFAVLSYHYGILLTLVTAIPIFITYIKTREAPYVYDSWWIYLEILAGCIVYACAQNTMTVANQNANPTTISLIRYVGVAYSFLADYLLFELNLSNLQVIGLIICINASVSAILYKLIATELKER